MPALTQAAQLSECKAHESHASTLRTIAQRVLEVAITSRRPLFSGARKTIDCKHSKLVGPQLYAGAIAIGVSNRQNASTFRLGDGPVVAAILNTAAKSQL